ncbi:hypothetical protein NYP20_12060 [Pseudomonas sp. N3-W]|uniref:hypothetical protein n=1 Tax=Pseudomonas sp. N3-W TaxID=2975049 RepID=UPI00217E618B|nr:hypothetical protein [Pseudomonas sp. N3-W]UWF51650.1 hypothetical protein NYP20_12060 [Pseudomonas sp. N3-W]
MDAVPFGKHYYFTNVGTAYEQVVSSPDNTAGVVIRTACAVRSRGYTGTVKPTTAGEIRLPLVLAGNESFTSNSFPILPAPGNGLWAYTVNGQVRFSYDILS